jgi:hypothetical protein
LDVSILSTSPFLLVIFDELCLTKPGRHGYRWLGPLPLRPGMAPCSTGYNKRKPGTHRRPEDRTLNRLLHTGISAQFVLRIARRAYIQVASGLPVTSNHPKVDVIFWRGRHSDVVDSVIGAVVGAVPFSKAEHAGDSVNYDRRHWPKDVSSCVGGPYPAAVFGTCGRPCGSLLEAARCTARASSMIRPAILPSG